ISVCGQPSVLYLRRSQPPSRYQPSSPCSAIFASTSSSVYGGSFSLVLTGNRLLRAHYITVPPLTLRACPVMNAAAGEARYTAAAATSAGVPQRFIGVDSATSRRRSSSACAPNAVSIHPGHRTLTRTAGASARARLLLNASTPPLTAANSWGFSPAMPVVTWSQLMLTIAPPRSRPRITSPAAYEQAIVPLRSTASSASSLRSHSHPAASPVSTSAPALLTQTSKPPRDSSASATRRSQPARVARSA